MPDALILALGIVAVVLGVIDQIMARGRSLLGWAVIALGLAQLLPAVL